MICAWNPQQRAQEQQRRLALISLANQNKTKEKENKTKEKEKTFEIKVTSKEERVVLTGMIPAVMSAPRTSMIVPSKKRKIANRMDFRGNYFQEEDEKVSLHSSFSLHNACCQPPFNVITSLSSMQ